MKKIQLLLSCLCGVLLLGTFLSVTRVLATTSSLIQAPITFPSPSPTPKPPATILLGGLSLNDYCLHLGQTAVKLTGNIWSCSPSGAPVDFNKACQFQYNISIATARQLDPKNPFSWQCFCGSNDFKAEYFDNQNLTGTPKVVRLDPRINMLTNSSPDPAIPDDHFSVRWSKTQSMSAGKYSFTLKSDDGIRFWVDNTLVVDDWTNHPTRIYTPDILVQEGNHSFKIEYFENTGSAVAILSEDSPARDRTSPAPIIIP